MYVSRDFFRRIAAANQRTRIFSPSGTLKQLSEPGHSSRHKKFPRIITSWTFGGTAGCVFDKGKCFLVSTPAKNWTTLQLFPKSGTLYFSNTKAAQRRRLPEFGLIRCSFSSTKTAPTSTTQAEFLLVNSKLPKKCAGHDAVRTLAEPVLVAIPNQRTSEQMMAPTSLRDKNQSLNVCSDLQGFGPPCALLLC